MRENLQEILGYLRKTEVRLYALVVPSILAAIASTFEGLTLALLIPVTNSLVAGELKMAFELPVLGPVDITKVVGLDYGRALAKVVVLIFAAAILKTVMVYLSGLALSKQTQRFTSRLRSLLYERYLGFGKLFFDRSSAGQLHQVITSFVGMVSQSLAIFNWALYATCTLLVYLVMMFFISWQLTMCVLCIFPLLHYSLRWLVRRIAQTSSKHTDTYNELGKKISSSLGGMTLVHAYGTEEQEARRFRSLSEHVAALEFSINKKSQLIGPIQEILLLGMMFLLVVLIGTFLVKGGPAGFGAYAVYLITMKRASTLFGVFNSIQAAIATATGPLSEIRKIFSDEEKFVVPDGAASCTGLQRGIELRNLSFTYPDGVSALSAVSFEVERGKVTALVGQSGAGKSTIINLLMRFYDTAPGTILVDGGDIRAFRIRSWREHIALVSQDTYLFHGTLRENLLYGLRRDVSETEVVDVLERARLLEFVRTIPNGLEAQIGDRGVKLSGGEKQRVSIARALLKRAEILLLDEPTSALDSTTEKLIQEALTELMLDRTTIVIAHRLSTIRHANKIVVLDRGRVIEQGDFESLKATQGKFFEYWENQRT